jgi:hypothetical protein
MIQARFKSIDVIDGAATLRWTPGIQPSSTCARLARAPRAGEEGEFVLGDGFGNRISVAMVVESVEEVSSVGGGRAWDVVLKDARAFWKFGAITGRYNQPDATGKPAREKTLRQLAEFCLDAMPRVRSHSTAALPMDEFPAVEWLWENPADALEALLGERFTVVFGFDGSVEIRRANEGRDYESVSPYLSRSLKTRRDKEYDGVVIVGERTIRQVTRVLMPMGLDVDDTWKPLKGLSYAPDKSKEDGGFCKEYMRDKSFYDLFHLAAGEERNVTKKKIWFECIPTILRVYGGIPAEELPLLNEICDKEFDENGLERYKTPFAVGPLLKAAIVNGRSVGNWGDGPLDGYKIDHLRGLVTFDDPQTQPAPGEWDKEFPSAVDPTHLQLVYAFEAKPSKKTDVYCFGDVDATEPLVVHRDELKLREKWPRAVYPLVIIPPPYQKQYAWQPLNKDDLDEYAGQVYRAYTSTSEEITGGSITLIGLKDDLAMDGLFRSATFTVGPQGSTTEIEWGIETPKIEIPTYKERFRRRQTDRVAGLGGLKMMLGAVGGLGLKIGRAFGAIGKQAYQSSAAGPPWFYRELPELILARNNTNDDVKRGKPVGPDTATPIGADGVWNFTYANDPGEHVFGVTTVDIPAHGVGYIKVAPRVNQMIDVVDIPNPVNWMRIKPICGTFTWGAASPYEATCVILVSVFSTQTDLRKPAIATILTSKEFTE